jgi:dethiobiotin synthetase
MRRCNNLAPGSTRNGGPGKARGLAVWTRFGFDGRVNRIFFITGTDTGAGKTVLTALVAAFLRREKISVAALKPLCSGGRDDARNIFSALGGALALAEINPWHFRAAVAPALAATLEKKSVRLRDVVGYVRMIQKKHEITLVEGAGGLMSPLGENFDSRDLILKLRALPVIVAQNRLGAVNHLRLTLAALPGPFRKQTRVVFMSPPKADAASRTNAVLLGNYFPAENIFTLPWLGKKFSVEKVLEKTSTRRTLQKILAG